MLKNVNDAYDIKKNEFNFVISDESEDIWVKLNIFSKIIKNK